MAERYFDDFKVGDKFATATKTVTQDMIVEFAKVYDPQLFHLDPVAAKQTHFGGLIASGFQTLALGFRLIWDTGIFAASSMGSPGFDDLRWLKPVRPGDTLRVEMEVTESRPSQSKPDRGIVRGAYRYVNQNGEAVLTFNSMHLLKRRPA
ncbi:MAG: MaoC family dehydratase [Alphaproteobacteria bacterium]|nr:MaoC family dehydratase [Alphaproteobacteria bacterium]MDE2514041.1 MaoC family dehydratase [Alphaproteobacteria bacterium]